MKNSCTYGCKGSGDKIGVLVAQLGTPDAPTPKALRRYLKQFLWDKRVIEANRIFWWFILNCIVLVTRPKRSARLYKRIWGKDGSPLLKITEAQTIGLKDRLIKIDPLIEVEFGMRYGSNSIESAIDNLCSKGVTQLVIVPMYPQYSATTTASIYDAAFAHLLKRRVIPSIRVLKPYYRDDRYLDALATTINRDLSKIDFEVERLVLSYHGIPKKYVDSGDIYCCQCTETTRLLAPRINLAPEKILHTFQSRFGKDPWLEPYTDETFEHLSSHGINQIAVAAPGFTADCLETLDELGNEGIEQFEEGGGKKYALIPCLNDDKVWLDALGDIVSDEISDWIDDNKKASNNSCKFTCPTESRKISLWVSAKDLCGTKELGRKCG